MNSRIFHGPIALSTNGFCSKSYFCASLLQWFLASRVFIRSEWFHRRILFLEIDCSEYFFFPTGITARDDRYLEYRTRTSQNLIQDVATYTPMWHPPRSAIVILEIHVR